jgi:hypothetical protein
MKYSPLLLLLAAAPAQASGWGRSCPGDRAEVRRIASLSALDCGALGGVVEQDRHAYNDRALMHYNRMRFTYSPTMSRPEAAPMPPDPKTEAAPTPPDPKPETTPETPPAPRTETPPAPSGARSPRYH